MLRPTEGLSLWQKGIQRTALNAMDVELARVFKTIQIWHGLNNPNSFGKQRDG